MLTMQSSLFSERGGSEQTVAEPQRRAAPHHLPRQESPAVPQSYRKNSTGERASYDEMRELCLNFLMTPAVCLSVNCVCLGVLRLSRPFTEEECFHVRL